MEWPFIRFKWQIEKYCKNVRKICYWWFISQTSEKSSWFPLDDALGKYDCSYNMRPTKLISAFWTKCKPKGKVWLEGKSVKSRKILQNKPMISKISSTLLFRNRTFHFLKLKSEHPWLDMQIDRVIILWIK